LLRSKGSLKEVFCAVNREFFEDETDLFITLLLGRLNPDKRQLEFLGAGHPKGYVIDAAGNIKNTLASSCMVLGVVGDLPLRDPQTAQIGGGDVLLFLTDGVLEARGPGRSHFGELRVLETVRPLASASAREIVVGLCAAVKAFTAGESAQDDVSVLAIKMEEPG
jgi:serine phosphatase RsbU (regulator of sigma subunit)